MIRSLLTTTVLILMAHGGPGEAQELKKNYHELPFVGFRAKPYLGRRKRQAGIFVSSEA